MGTRDTLLETDALGTAFSAAAATPVAPTPAARRINKSDRATEFVKRRTCRPVFMRSPRICQFPARIRRKF
jgi:hypothetical protein